MMSIEQSLQLEVFAFECPICEIAFENEDILKGHLASVDCEETETNEKDFSNKNELSSKNEISYKNESNSTKELSYTTESSTALEPCPLKALNLTNELSSMELGTTKELFSLREYCAKNDLTSREKLCSDLKSKKESINPEVSSIDKLGYQKSLIFCTFCKEQFQGGSDFNFHLPCKEKVQSKLKNKRISPDPDRITGNFF